jgi:hypothetical protein
MRLSGGCLSFAGIAYPAGLSTTPSRSEQPAPLAVYSKSVEEEFVTDPIVVTISHQLGREEAKRRLDSGLGHVRGQLAAFVSSLEYGWTGYRLDFSLTAMRQRIVGCIDVDDRFVRVELGLPLLLGLLSKSIVSRIRREGLVLLDKPSS